MEKNINTYSTNDTTMSAKENNEGSSEVSEVLPATSHHLATAGTLVPRATPSREVRIAWLKF